MTFDSNKHNLRLLDYNLFDDLSCNDKFELMLVNDIDKRGFN